MNRIVFVGCIASLCLLAGCFGGSASQPTAGVDEGAITMEIIDETPAPASNCVSATAAAVPTNPPAFVDLPLTVYDCPSPNFDRRTRRISMIVLHYTATWHLREALNALCNGKSRSRVSAHYVVDVDGAIYRLVDESKRAWHAGVSRWKGLDDVNSSSIGIEIVNRGPLGNGQLASYPARQIDAVIRLCRNIQARYAISDVVAHGDIAPERKLDPGENFPWRRLAAAGIGVWTDGFASPTASPETLLRRLGYDTRNFYCAMQAFKRHYYPEGLTPRGFARTEARLAAVAALPKEKGPAPSVTPAADSRP